MKQLCSFFIFVICIFSFVYETSAAGRDPAASPLATPDVTINGKRAKSVYEILKKAGAKVTQSAEFSSITVEGLECTTGVIFVAGKVHNICNCSSTSGGVSVTNTNASKLYKTLEGAGVVPDTEIENSTIKINAINCVVGFLMAKSIYNCNIDIQ